MKRWRRAALATAALAAASAHAEPVVFVSGATLRSGEIAEILELPDGSMLRATNLIAEFWRSAQDPGATLGYDVATQRFRDDVEPYLGAAGLDRLRESHDWFLYDAAIRGFVPLGQGPIVPAAAGSPSGLLEQPGAVLVAAARAPAASDQDGDGIPDAFDDCIDVPNGPAEPGPLALVQRDTNGDDYGNVCDPDLNDDGIVNFVDLAMMKRVFFRRSSDADLNGDGIVNFTDLARLKAFFFKPPGPSGRVR